MPLSHTRMGFLNKQVFLPIILLLDYTTFLFLVSVYKPRRKEFRVRQLFLDAFLGFAVTITFARDNTSVTQALNEISETCSQMMFLIQITIIGRDVQTKVKLRSIKWCTIVAEFLIFLDWLTVIAIAANLMGGGFISFLDLWGNVLESFNLTFVLFFRFYYLSISKGFWYTARQRKTELLAYLLLMTHEYPWYFVDAYTGVSWEYVQGIYQRSLIAWCIILNRWSKTSASAKSSSTAKSRAHREETIRSKRHSVTNSIPRAGALKYAVAAVVVPSDKSTSSLE